ncbi:MAG: hypothetical protein ABI134_10000 [Byssovorax sp.]
MMGSPRPQRPFGYLLLAQLAVWSMVMAAILFNRSEALRWSGAERVMATVLWALAMDVIVLWASERYFKT